MSFRRIGDDNYSKKNNSKQELTNENSDEILKILKEYINVPKYLCKYLILGAQIKYINNNGEFRYGGILIKNEPPLYIVLLNPYRKITWSVNLDNNNIFMEDVKKKNEKKKIKNTLYKLYENNLINLHP